MVDVGIQRSLRIRTASLAFWIRSTGPTVTMSGGRWGKAEFWAPMAGSFNVSNALAGIATGLGLGVPLEDACRAIGPNRVSRPGTHRGSAVALEPAKSSNASTGSLVIVVELVGDPERFLVDGTR